MVAIQGVPVDTIGCTDLEPSSAALSTTVTTMAGGAAVSGEPVIAEQQSASTVDASTVRVLLNQMRTNGARVQMLIDPASVNRSWIRRGRVFWLQQRRPISLTQPDGADEVTCCQQDQEHLTDGGHHAVDLPILGGVLSYDTADPVQLRFGFRRARYILRRSALCRRVGSQGASSPRTPCSGRDGPPGGPSDQTDEHAGGLETGEVGEVEREAAIESDRVVALAEAWLSETSSE